MNNTTNLHRQTESTFSWLPRNVTATTESTTFPGSEVTDHHNVPNEITQEDSSIHNSTDSTTHWLQRTEDEERVMNDTTTHWLQRSEEEEGVMNDTTTPWLQRTEDEERVMNDTTTHWLQRTEEEEGVMNDTTTPWLQRTEDEERVMNDTTTHWLQRTEEEEGVMNDTTTPWLQRTEEEGRIMNDTTTHWLQRTEEEDMVMNDTTTHWLQRTEEEGRVMNETTTEMLYLIREDTQVEMILNTVFTAFFLVTILTANILLLVVMWRFKRLQPCNRLIRTVTAICDIILSITGANLVTSITAFKYLSPNWFCLINSKVLSFCLSVLINVNALLAVERYIFIVHPMKYQVWVNKSKIILSLLGIIFSPIIYLSINTFLNSTELRSASLICVNQSRPILFFIFLILPGVVITSMGIINLYRFLRKAAANSSEKLDAKKAIKLVLLLSGAIFITYFPAYIIRIAVVQVWSWEELDAGVNITAFIAVRCASFTISLVSSACNPMIQFYVEKDLWVGLRKIMGQKAYFSEQLDALEAANSRN